MKIFLVGGAGYIGSVCTEQLLNEGHEVAVFDNLSEGHHRAVDPRARFIEGDLAHREQIETALSSCRSDAVMHFAANALVGESMQNPSKYFRNNISNGLNLLDAIVAAASGFYNLGTGGGSSVREVIAACRKITGRKIHTVEKPRRPGDPARLIASSEKIKNELGWRPQFQSLDAIIESAWKWHQKYPDGYED